MDNDELNTVYISYNGMNRPAMFGGMPLIPFILCLLALMLTFFIGVLTIGFYGLILPAMITGVMLTIKQMCADDPNALTYQALRFKGLALRGLRANNILKVE